MGKRKPTCTNPKKEKPLSSPASSPKKANRIIKKKEPEPQDAINTLMSNLKVGTNGRKDTWESSTSEAPEGLDKLFDQLAQCTISKNAFPIKQHDPRHKSHTPHTNYSDYAPPDLPRFVIDQYNVVYQLAMLFRDVYYNAIKEGEKEIEPRTYVEPVYVPQEAVDSLQITYGYGIAGPSTFMEAYEVTYDPELGQGDSDKDNIDSGWQADEMDSKPQIDSHRKNGETDSGIDLDVNDDEAEEPHDLMAFDFEIENAEYYQLEFEKRMKRMIIV